MTEKPQRQERLLLQKDNHVNQALLTALIKSLDANTSAINNILHSTINIVVTQEGKDQKSSSLFLGHFSLPAR